MTGERRLEVGAENCSLREQDRNEKTLCTVQCYLYLFSSCFSCPLSIGQRTENTQEKCLWRKRVKWRVKTYPCPLSLSLSLLLWWLWEMTFSTSDIFQLPNKLGSFHPLNIFILFRWPLFHPPMRGRTNTAVCSDRQSLTLFVERMKGGRERGEE